MNSGPDLVPDARRSLGAAGEDAVAEWYAERGFELIDRNWRVRGGEIDLIVSDGRVLVFCEVKTRTSDRFGTGLDAVTPTKQARLRRLGVQWLAASERPWRGPIRFDVVALLVRPDGTALTIVEGAF